RGAGPPQLRPPLASGSGAAHAASVPWSGAPTLRGRADSAPTPAPTPLRQAPGCRPAPGAGLRAAGGRRLRRAAVGAGPGRQPGGGAGHALVVAGRWRARGLGRRVAGGLVGVAAP